MEQSLQLFIDQILQERTWSWTVIGIAYLIVGLTIRSWFIGPIVRRSKELNRKNYHDFKSAYLKRSIWGWLFFLASFLTVIGLWSTVISLPMSVKQALAILGAIICFIFSIVFHLTAYGIAALTALKQASETEKEP